MSDITDQDSNYSSSSNSSLYKRIYDEKTPINQSVTYYAPNDNSGNQNTKDNINSIDERPKKKIQLHKIQLKLTKLQKKKHMSKCLNLV